MKICSVFFLLVGGHIVNPVSFQILPAFLSVVNLLEHEMILNAGIHLGMDPVEVCRLYSCHQMIFLILNAVVSLFAMFDFEFF